MGSSNSKSAIIVDGKDSYEVGRCLGKGSFGNVRAIVPKVEGSLPIYAIKEVLKEEVISGHSYASMVDECNLLGLVQDWPFVVKIYEAFQTEYLLCIRMAFLSGGELRYHLLEALEEESGFSEEAVRFYGGILMQTLGYMHGRGVIHRDIKPENILLDAEGYCYLTDFNVASQLKEGETYNSAVGTLCYMAPEVLAPNSPADTSADWWSLGCVLFELATGRKPFNYHRDGIHNYKEQLETILAVKPTLNFRNMSEDLSDVINHLLCVDPKERYGHEQTSKHKFFAGFMEKWDKIKAKQCEAPIQPSKHTINFDPGVEMEDFLVTSGKKKRNLSIQEQERFIDWDWEDNKRLNKGGWLSIYKKKIKMKELAKNYRTILRDGLLVHANAQDVSGRVIFDFSTLPLYKSFSCEDGFDITRIGDKQVKLSIHSPNVNMLSETYPDGVNDLGVVVNF